MYILPGRRESAQPVVVSRMPSFVRLRTKNVRSQAYRDARGAERDVMVALLGYAKDQPKALTAATWGAP